MYLILSIFCGTWATAMRTRSILLVGKTSQDNFIGSSTAAYKSIYPPIRDAILSGEDVCVEYIDFDGKMIKDLNKENVSNNEEDIMSILSTEIKNLKKEVKSLRQTIILKGMQAN